MKFALATALSSLLVGLATAQSIAIGFPADRTHAKAGSSVLVEVDRPDTLTGSQEVAVVIAVNSCHQTTCIPPADVLGSILYNGPYNPQFHSTSKPPHQNFTVTLPSALPQGPAQLAVYHVTLIGAGPEPFTEVKNITLLID